MESYKIVNTRMGRASRKISDKSASLLMGALKKSTRKPKRKIKLSGLTFQDVVIHPGKTQYRPDNVHPCTELFVGLKCSIPVMAASMDTVWSVELTIALAEAGCVAPLARDLPLAALTDALNRIASHEIDINRYPNAITRLGRPVICATASPFDDERVEFLLAHPSVDYLLLETVQPYSDHVLNRLERWTVKHPHKIIVGNIATREAALEFCKFSLAAIKVGLGAGSICTTRTLTGVGVPQLEAIQQVAKVARKKSIPLISDGGIRHYGDIAKAIAAGADGVMMGRAWAATKESPGKLIVKNGKQYKKYHASIYSSVEYSESDPTISDEANAFLKMLNEDGFRLEGVNALVPYAGPAQVLVHQIRKSIASSMAFVGAKTISEFQSKAKLRKVSNFGNGEGEPHSLAYVESVVPRAETQEKGSTQ